MVFRNIERQGTRWKFDCDSGREYRISATKTGQADASLEFFGDNGTHFRCSGRCGPQKWVAGETTNYVHASVSRVSMETVSESRDSDDLWTCSFRKDATSFSFTIQIVH